MSDSAADNLLAAEIDARGPRHFKFRFLVPKTWVLASSSNEALTQATPSPIAIFAAPENPSIALQVVGIALANEISAANWLRYYFNRRGWNVAEVRSDGPRKARANGSFIVSGLPMSVIATATVNGETIIVIQGIAPAASFELYRQTLETGVNSYTIANAFDPNVIEPWSTIQLTPERGFQFPASWLARRTADSGESKVAVDLMRLDAKKAVEGIVRVKAIRNDKPTDLAQAILLTVREFQDSGLSLDAGGAPTESPPHGPWRRVMSLDLEGRTDAKTPLSFLVYGFQNEQGVFVVACMGPTAKANFYQWAINVRAYEIALASLSM